MLTGDSSTVIRSLLEMTKGKGAYANGRFPSGRQYWTISVPPFLTYARSLELLERKA